MRNARLIRIEDADDGVQLFHFADGTVRINDDGPEYDYDYIEENFEDYELLER